MSSENDLTPSTCVSINVSLHEHGPRIVHEDEYGRRYESPALATCGRDPTSRRASFSGSVRAQSSPTIGEHHLGLTYRRRTSPIIIHQDEHGRRYQSNALATRRSISFDAESQSHDEQISTSESEEIDVNDEEIRQQLSALISTLIISRPEPENRSSEQINATLNQILVPISQASTDEINGSGYILRQYWKRFVHCRSKCIICKWTADRGDQQKRPFECKRCLARKCFDCCRDEFKKDIFMNDRSFSCRACRAPVSDTVAKRFIGDYLYKKHLYFRSKREFAQDSTALWCPKEACWKLLTSRLNPSPSDDKIVSCVDCGTNVCRACGRMNDNCVCLKYQNAHIRDELWKLLHTRRCPSCECPIAGYIGSARFFCTNCGNHLCWRCRSFIDCEGGIPKRHRCSGMGMMKRLKNVVNAPIQFTRIIIASVVNSRNAANQPLCISRKGR